MMIIIKNVLTIPDIKILDKDLLKEVPYFNDTIVVDETDKLKKKRSYNLWNNQTVASR